MAFRRQEKAVRITTAAEHHGVERDARVHRYVISMSIRTLCFIGVVLAPSPWRWILLVGAVLLPYVAVVGANAMSNDLEETDLVDSPDDHHALPGGHG